MQIIILHGWAQSAQDWEGLETKLGKRAVSMEMPGFGDEPLISKRWGVSEYADWVMKKINKNKNTIIIGHSFGGRVAAEIGSRQPGWLKGLILSGAPCLYRPSLRTKLRVRIYKFLKLFLPKKYRVYFYTRDLANAGEMGLEQVFRDVVNYDQTSQIQKINVPTLIVWGERDHIVPMRIAEEMNSLIDKSELKIIEGAGHNSYFDNPNLFYGYVKTYIDNISNR